MWFLIHLKEKHIPAIFLVVFCCSVFASSSSVRAKSIDPLEIWNSTLTLAMLSRDLEQSEDPDIRLLADIIVELTDITLLVSKVLVDALDNPSASKFAKNFVPGKKAYALLTDIIDLHKSLSDLNTARKEGHKEAQAQAILEATTLAFQTGTDLAAFSLELGAKFNLAATVAKAEVVIIDLAVDYYGDLRRSDATENSRKMMELQNNTIDVLRAELDIYVTSRESKGGINVNEINNIIKKRVQSAIYQMENPPFNNLAAKGEGVSWGAEKFFTDNVEAKTYLEVYSYLQNIINGKNKRFSISEVAKRVAGYNQIVILGNSLPKLSKDVIRFQEGSKFNLEKLATKHSPNQRDNQIESDTREVPVGTLTDLKDLLDNNKGGIKLSLRKLLNIENDALVKQVIIYAIESGSTSILREILLLHLKPFAGGVSEERFKVIHFDRNEVNQPEQLSYQDVTREGSGFKKLPLEKSVFHQIGHGNTQNEKWVSSDGRQEYVFKPVITGDSPKIKYIRVENPINRGTFNLFNPQGSTAAAHLIYDVIPWLLWGNDKEDDTKIEYRKRLFVEASKYTAGIITRDYLEKTLERCSCSSSKLSSLKYEPSPNDVDAREALAAEQAKIIALVKKKRSAALEKDRLRREKDQQQQSEITKKRSELDPLKAQIAKWQTTSDRRQLEVHNLNAQRKKTSRQISDLDTQIGILKSRQNSDGTVVKQLEDELETINQRVKLLRTANSVIYKLKKKKLKASDLPEPIIDALKEYAKRLGTKWYVLYQASGNMLLTAGRERLKKIEELERSKTYGGLSTAEIKKLNRLTTHRYLLKRTNRKRQQQLTTAQIKLQNAQHQLANYKIQLSDLKEEINRLSVVNRPYRARTKKTYARVEDWQYEIIKDTSPKRPRRIDSSGFIESDLNERNANSVTDNAVPNIPSSSSPGSAPITTPSPTIPLFGGITSVDQSPASVFSVTKSAVTNSALPNIGETVPLDVLTDPLIVSVGNIQATAAGKYQYTAWGEWNGSITITNQGTGQDTTFNRGLFAVGQPTPTSYINQLTGTATYVGGVLADYGSQASGVLPGSVTGAINLTADFDNSTMTGGMNISGPNGFTATPSFIANFAAAGSQGVGYGGAMADANGGGGIQGVFFGPAAQETAGSFFYFNASGENATGIFHAKQ